MQRVRSSQQSKRGRGWDGQAQWGLCGRAGNGCRAMCGAGGELGGETAPVGTGRLLEIYHGDRKGKGERSSIDKLGGR